MVYFVQAVDGGPIKIGFSENLGRRIKQLESTYKTPLVLLKTVRGCRKKEAEIHARFSHLRLGNTEQFQPASDLMTFIGRPLLVGANPDAVEMMESKANLRIYVTFRCRSEYRDWLLDFARKERLTPTQLIDFGLIELAKLKGFNPPPER